MTCNDIAQTQYLAYRAVGSTSCEAIPRGKLLKEIEIVEPDLSYIKKEIKDEDDNEHDDGEVDKAISNPMVHESPMSVQLYCAKYVASMRRRAPNLRASERMLIVQCPGCTVEFRGACNRMVRLIDHIEKRHHKFTERYLRVIVRKYGSLMGLAKIIPAEH